jgi:metal-sulfur cluster biosynthetic enzyme
MNVITNNDTKCAIALAALHDEVMDPEIGLNIVDLGLIYQVDFDEAQEKIFCRMTLTTQFCPMGESITDAAKEVLQSVFPGYEITVELTFNPPWSYEKISAEGQIFLKGR